MSQVAATGLFEHRSSNEASGLPPVYRTQFAGKRLTTVDKPPIAAINELIGWIKGEARIVNLDKARESKGGSWVCSTEKLKSEVGFHCVRILETRLRQTANWYQEQGWLPASHGVLQVS